MSHFTTIETQVRDLDALRQALGELGVTLHENCNARGYAGNTLRGDYVIRLKGHTTSLSTEPRTARMA
jgi:hypothetical protein